MSKRSSGSEQRHVSQETARRDIRLDAGSRSSTDRPSTEFGWPFFSLTTLFIFN
jgi:hypothetical protein